MIPKLLPSLNTYINLLYPPSCVLCKKECMDANLLCCSCWSKMIMFTHNICKKCGNYIFTDMEDRVEMCSYEKCCNDHHVYISATSAIYYNDIAKKLVAKLKYTADFKVMKIIGVLLSNLISRYEYDMIDVVLPVPLHKSRMRQRKYNQSAILGRIISQKISKKCYEDILIKVQNTPYQSDLNQRQRLKNLKNCFSIKETKKCFLKDKNVLIIDDVITTGSTLNECSETLLRHGVNSVYCISFARH